MVDLRGTEPLPRESNSRVLAVTPQINFVSLIGFEPILLAS